MKTGRLPRAATRFTTPAFDDRGLRRLLGRDGLARRETRPLSRSRRSRSPRSRLRLLKEACGHGVIEGVIWEVSEPLPPSKHRIKYRLVYVLDGERVVGYDNERSKGDHRHIRGAEMTYAFRDVSALLRDFLRNVKEVQS